MQISATTVVALFAVLSLINGPLLSADAALLCTTAKTFSDVVAVVNLALKQKHTEVCFNPFHVIKPTGITLVLNGPISLTCMQKSSNDKCVIEGGGNHFNIAGGSAKVEIVGFTFIGATQSAIRVLATAPTNHHSIVDCIFVNNQGSMTNGRGGAIKTELGTFLTVSKCHFENNKAAGGGAIFHRGKMLAVTDSSFYNNIAKEGGAIMFDSTHGPVLARCIFVNNHAISSNGGAIELYKSEFTTYDTLSGSGNSPCNGIYDNSEKVCRKWDLPSTGNSVDIGQVTVSSLGLRLSKGLSAKIIAQAGKSVEYKSPERFRSSSQLKFHTNPDGAAVFPLNDGGWIYMSNAENEKAQGGVFGVEFDSHGRPRNYMSYLTGTTRNCSGGKTPWNTWVSCEEYDGGLCWQVDPTGERKSVKTKLVEGPGSYESMAFDISDPNDPSFFVTEDHERGAIRRFKPVCNNLDLSWNLLQVDGEIDYLQFTGRNTFQWTSSLDKGRNSAQAFYPNVEGISVNGRILSFVAKTQKEIFHLNLDNGTYTVESTERGLLLGGGSFSAEPDQIIQYGHVLYFTEDGGSTPGIYASDGVDYYTLFEADDKKFSGDETTGLAFSPDGTRLYVCIQAIGYLFEITRNDGLPFPGQQGVSHLRLRHTK